MQATQTKSTDQRADKLVVDAKLLFEHAVRWQAFYEKVFGVGGLIQQAFPVVIERMAFERSPHHARLMAMLRELQVAGEAKRQEPPAVITVRMPQAVHLQLKAEAHDRRLSLNQLCVDKLLAPHVANGEATS